MKEVYNSEQALYAMVVDRKRMTKMDWDAAEFVTYDGREFIDEDGEIDIDGICFSDPEKWIEWKEPEEKKELRADPLLRKIIIDKANTHIQHVIRSCDNLTYSYSNSHVVKSRLRELFYVQGEDF